MDNKAIDRADAKWLEYHSRIWQQLQDGQQWWGRKGFHGEFSHQVPKMHILESLTRAGERGDALYVARCGYKYTFSRLLIEKPRAMKRPPRDLIRCITCLRV